jgi:tRNA threonylcarbamoyladenosine biosynthesis protein TsaB
MAKSIFRMKIWRAKWKAKHTIRSMKNILAIEASSAVLSVALKKGKESISETKLVGFLKHAENLVLMIDDLLRKEKLSIGAIDVFLIGRGPGSFTGLRIAFATLKGFLALKKKPCFGALSLDMIAENIQLPEGSRLAVCLDARREKIYARFYQLKKGVWLPKKQPRVLSFSELISELPSDIHLAGDALTRYGKDLENHRDKKKIHFLPESAWHPRARTLIHWFETKDKKLKILTKPRDFLPLYFRLPEASAKMKGGEKRKTHAFC